MGGHFEHLGTQRAQKELILSRFGSPNRALFDEFGGRVRKVPTCVWIEPARSDCMLGLSGLAQKSMKKWIGIVTYSRRCFLRDFSRKSEVNGLPKVHQSSPRGANGDPMASQGHPKIITLASFFGEVVQRGSRVLRYVVLGWF